MVDKHNTKIAVSDLETIEQLLDQTPTYHDTKISKRQAIGRLAPKLHAMRGKGYSWTAVAQWLTEHGLSVSTAVLHGYLRYTPPTRGAGSMRPSNSRRERMPAGEAIVSTALPATEQAAPVPMPAQREGDRSKPAPKELPALKRDHTSRRSEFPVRPDSHEI